MNKQELIEYCESLKGDLNKFINGVDVDKIIANIEQLDEPQPIKLKDVIVRIKQLDIGTRKVWLDEFLNKLGSDYGLLKYKAGYEQGKLEGAMEREKVIVPQFVADWIEEARETAYNIRGAIEMAPNGRMKDWLELKNVNTFAEAWVNGYEVEKEKRYLVKIIGITNYNSYLNYHKVENKWTIESRAETDTIRTGHTRKELEEAGFGWVFDCEGVEVEEVE